MRNLPTSDIEQNSDVAESLIAEATRNLPSLPSIIRYEDDYTGIVRSIDHAADAEVWELTADAKKVRVNWAEMPQSVVPLLRNWLCWHLQKYDCTTTLLRAIRLRPIAPAFPSLIAGLLQRPHIAAAFWKSNVMTWAKDEFDLAIVKTILQFMCQNLIGDWTPAHREMIAQWPLGFRRDKFVSIRTGDAFLSSNEEASIVSFFDELNIAVRNGKQVTAELLRDSCLLYWIYQHAFRPIQVASLNLNDARLRLSKANDAPAIHVTFHRAKQRSSKERLPMLRKMKRDWAWMMATYLKHRSEMPHRLVTEQDRPNSLFGLPPQAIQLAIKRITRSITGIERTPTELRHTAAQRLVDSGASEVELAEFLGHSIIDTGLVYFDTSPTQADRVNKALGLSPVYSRIAEVAKTRTIDMKALLQLPDDKQVGAIPHGIPIAGIGGCDMGQSLCAKNPAVSCYTCSKFMPLADATVHAKIRDQFREVVKGFSGSSRGDVSSPAFMQLRRTLEAIEGLVADIEERSATPNA